MPGEGQNSQHTSTGGAGGWGRGWAEQGDGVDEKGEHKHREGAAGEGEKGGHKHRGGGGKGAEI